MIEMENIVNEFLIESHENLDQLDRDLVALETDPQDRARLASIFRTIHTIKGTCGFLSFSKLESVTHVGESLLSLLRDGQLVLNPEITSALLALVDAVRNMLAIIESSGEDGNANYSELIEKLTRLQENPDATNVPAVAVEARCQTSETPVPPVATEAAAPQWKAEREPTPIEGAETGDGPAEALPAAQEVKSAVSESNIRVDVRLLDKLMNLVGELVLARNQVLQFTATQKDAAFLGTSQRLNLITTELQEGVMKTRMQPIGNIWNRFPRVVRDLATACGKKVRIEMEGKETELDKTIIEAIKDPLTHMVRNAVDHGIEPPEARLARGKPAEGCLFLRAFHEGSLVNLEFSDDGAGLDPDRIKWKALERGLISRDQAARMNDRDCIHLIFLPGFSTAEKVTSISGRGVGMDVVKINIEKIGGTVEVQSQRGKGTTLKIKIPLTLAIIPALIVTSGGDRYAIPQVNLLELVRFEAAQARKNIERMHGAPVYRLRGKLLPLVYLNRELKVEEKARQDDAAINIVVLQADNRQFGLVVEGINDTEEIVVKPLGKLLKGIPQFAGSTIMGDGRVALILDVLGIAQGSGVVSEVHDRSLVEQAAKSQEQRGTCQSLLLCGLGQEHRLAIPLSVVARLEEIPVSAVERAADQEVVQYRGQILPLIRLANVLGYASSPAAPDAPLVVVVYAEQGRSVGLVVDRILDIVETTLDMQRTARRRGIQGSAVIQQRVTDLLDVHDIIRGVDADFFEPALT